MAVNPLTGIFSRIWSFVDHRLAADEVTRADLDIAFDDFVPAINQALQAQVAAERAATYVGRAFDTLALLQADTALTYATGSATTVAIGDIVQARDIGATYEVADPAATDAHIATAGSVKLYYLPTRREATMGRVFTTAGALLADTSMSYTAGAIGTVSAGDAITTAADGAIFQVAASSASDHTNTTAGGIKLYRRNNPAELAGWRLQEAVGYIASFTTAYLLPSGTYYWDASTSGKPMGTDPGYTAGIAMIYAMEDGGKVIDVISENMARHIRRTVTAAGSASPWADLVTVTVPTVSAGDYTDALITRNPDGSWGLIPNGDSGDVLAFDVGGAGWTPAPVGVGVTVTSPARAHSTTYVNAGARARAVYIRGSAGSVVVAQISADGTTWFSAGIIGTSDSCASFTVPPGFSYRLNGPATITSWVEVA